MARSLLALACVLLHVMPAGAQTPPASENTVPTDAESRRILVDRIDVQKQGIGIVVGVIEPHGRHIVAYGSLERDSIANLGALQAVTFKSVGPGGADIYELKFEHGALEWRIFLDAAGKIAGQFFRPLP